MVGSNAHSVAQVILPFAGYQSSLLLANRGSIERIGFYSASWYTNDTMLMYHVIGAEFGFEGMSE